MTIALRTTLFLLVCFFQVGVSLVWDRPVQAATTYYSIQLGSFPNEKSAVQFYEKIKSLPQARIERIGKYYTARVGLWQDRSDAEAILADVRNIAPGATIRKALYRTERLIVPDSLDDPAAASTPKPVPQEPRQEQVKGKPEPSSSPQPPTKKPAETPAASTSSPAAGGLFYSFQLGSFATEADAQQTYTRIKDLPDARIERIGKAYTARFGLWQNRADAVEFRAAAKKIAPDAYLRTARHIPDRIILMETAVEIAPAVQPESSPQVDAPQAAVPPVQNGKSDTVSASSPASTPDKKQAASRYLFYSFHFGSFPDKAAARVIYEKIKMLPQARVEYDGQAYLARFGLWKEKRMGEAYLPLVREIATDATLQQVTFPPDQIVLPSFSSN